jgi:hypothetical protein
MDISLEVDGDVQNAMAVADVVLMVIQIKNGSN